MSVGMPVTLPSAMTGALSIDATIPAAGKLAGSTEAKKASEIARKLVLFLFILSSGCYWRFVR